MTPEDRTFGWVRMHSKIIMVAHNDCATIYRNCDLVLKKMFIIFAFLSLTSAELRCLYSSQKSLDCSFYQDCLQDIYKCAPGGYPLDYGFKYCTKFVSRFEHFPEEGQHWIDGTLKCLKEALLPVSFSRNSTCTEIKNIAFDSHPKCYIENGFCELFTKSTALKTVTELLNVYEIKDMVTLISMKQIFGTLSMCGAKIFDSVLQLAKQILAGYKKPSPDKSLLLSNNGILYTCDKQCKKTCELNGGGKECVLGCGCRISRFLVQ